MSGLFLLLPCFVEFSKLIANIVALIWAYIVCQCPFYWKVGKNGLLYNVSKSLRKYAYSNILKFLSPKNENFQMKNSDYFHISAQNIDCRYSLEPPRRGGSNEYHNLCFWSRNKKNNVYPCKPQFYYIKVGFKGVKII